MHSIVSGQNARRLIVLVACLSILTLVGTGIAASQLQQHATERDLPETADPGETIEVTVTTQADVPLQTIVLDERFEPEIEDASVVPGELTVDSEPVFPTIQLGDASGLQVILDGDGDRIADSGDEIVITYEVTLPEEPGEYTISGNIDGTDMDGESETVDIGTDTVEVLSEGAPNFELVEVDPETATTVAGMTETYRVTVENTGTATGSVNVTIDVEGAGTGTERLTLDAGESETTDPIEPDTISDLDPDTYDVTTLLDGTIEQTGSLTVIADDTDQDEDEEEETDDTEQEDTDSGEDEEEDTDLQDGDETGAEDADDTDGSDSTDREDTDETDSEVDGQEETDDVDEDGTADAEQDDTEDTDETDPDDDGAGFGIILALFALFSTVVLIGSVSNSSLFCTGR